MGQYKLRRPPAAPASTAKGQHPPATSLQKDRPGKSLIIGIAGLLSIAVVGTPVIIDLRTPRVTSIDYIDVSDSAQKYKPFLDVATCNHNRLDLQSRHYEARIICNYNFI